MTSRNARMSVVADLSTAPCSSSNPQSRFDVRAIGAHPSIRARPRPLTLCFQVNRGRDVVGERVTLLEHVKLTIYLGAYAFQARFGAEFRNRSEAAEQFRSVLPNCIVLPHPSPRNGMWASQRPWFEKDLLPALRSRVKEVLA